MSRTVVVIAVCLLGCMALYSLERNSELSKSQQGRQLKASLDPRTITVKPDVRIDVLMPYNLATRMGQHMHKSYLGLTLTTATTLIWCMHYPLWVV